MATAVVMPEVETKTPVKNLEEALANKCFILRTRFGMIGNTRKVPTSQVEVKANKKWVKVTKILVESEELDAIKKLDSDMRAWLFQKCITFGEAAFVLVPFKRVTMVDEKFREFEKERELLVDAFVKAYPGLIKKAEKELDDTFNAGDYLPQKYVKGKFTFRYQYLNFGTPGKLKEVSPELFRNEQAKTQESWKEALDEARGILRAALLQLVTHLAERLEEEGGTPKVFRETTITKLQDFLADFDVKNEITSDTELQALVKKARGLVTGVSVEELRVTDTVRDKVRSGMEDIGKTLDRLLVDRPSRKFRFDED